MFLKNIKPITIWISFTLFFIISCNNASTDKAKAACKYLNLWLSDCGGQCSMVEDCEDRYNAMEDPDEREFWDVYSRILYNDGEVCPTYGVGDFYVEKANESIGVVCNFYCGDGLCTREEDPQYIAENLVNCPEDCSIRLCQTYTFYADEHSCMDTPQTTCHAPAECYDKLYSIATSESTPFTTVLEECLMDMSLGGINCDLGQTVDGTPCIDIITSLIPPDCGEN
jgi:hypothetical protein